MGDDPRDIHATVGVLLGDAREAVGLSQSQVGKRLAVPQSRIAKLELGIRRLLFVEALSLAKLYRTSISQFDPYGATAVKPARRARVDARRLGAG